MLVDTSIIVIIGVMETLSVRDSSEPRARRLLGLIKKLASRLSPPEGPGENLWDYDVTNTSRTATFVLASAEGPRFVPGDVTSSQDLEADIDDLFGGMPAQN